MSAFDDETLRALKALQAKAANEGAPEWREAPGFKCMVTRCGSVRGRTRDLAGWLDSDGYRRVNVYDIAKGGFRQVPVHALVAATFIGPRPTPDHQVAHADGCRANNAVTNLRWATAYENQRDRDRHGTHNRGARNVRAHLTDEQAAEIRRAYIPRSRSWGAKALAARYGTTFAVVRTLLEGRTYSLHRQ